MTILMYPYDLQLHTNLSDGDYPLDDVVAKAKDVGLKGISITDHNLAHGVNHKAASAREVGLQAIPGTEISAKYEGIEVHILGYAISFDEAILQAGLQETIDGYNARSQEIIKKINQSDIARLDFDELLAQKGLGNCVVRYDIARALAKAMSQPLQKVKKLLDTGQPFYVPYGDWAMLPMEAVALVHQSGGKAVFSHPGETERKMGEEKFRALFTALLDAGLDGVEVFSAKHTPVEQKKYQDLAEKHRLFVTGGSDYHGDIHHPELTLGLGGLNEEQFNLFFNRLT